MTHRTTEFHDQTTSAIADTFPASISNRLAALLAQDDIVRPELRNAVILGEQTASLIRQRDGRHQHTLARRS